MRWAPRPHAVGAACCSRSLSDRRYSGVGDEEQVVECRMRVVSAAKVREYQRGTTQACAALRCATATPPWAQQTDVLLVGHEDTCDRGHCFLSVDRANAEVIDVLETAAINCEWTCAGRVAFPAPPPVCFVRESVTANRYDDWGETSSEPSAKRSLPKLMTGRRRTVCVPLRFCCRSPVLSGSGPPRRPTRPMIESLRSRTSLVRVVTPRCANNGDTHDERCGIEAQNDGDDNRCLLRSTVDA